MPDYRPQPADAADTAAIFQSWQLAGLTLKNRLLRSSISGRIDNYDGSGTPARVNFEERFARGGVAAIISSHVKIPGASRFSSTSTVGQKRAGVLRRMRGLAVNTLQIQERKLMSRLFERTVWLLNKGQRPANHTHRDAS